MVGSMDVLYLTYDGLADHIGQSQVLPYLLGCAEGGHRITVISFEKQARMERYGEEVRRRCSAAGIDWRPQRFRSWPPLLAKAMDMARMGRAAARAARDRRFDFVHCRSYPAASVGLTLKRRRGLPLLFDMRGFWPNQRREGGRWRAHTLLGRFLYNRWKSLESELYAEADHIVVLTSAARDVIAASSDHGNSPISVIPCCADFDLFQPASPAERKAIREELGLAEDDPVLVYLGSLGTVYRLDAIIRLFAATRERLPRAKLLFIGSGPTEPILAEARHLGVQLQPEDLRSVSATRGDVPRFINAGDVGLCFCTPTFSSLGVSATKVGEYLACGLPVIGNRQIGDFARIVEAVGSAHAVDDLAEPTIHRAADTVPALLQADRDIIRGRAAAFLDLRRGVDAYRQLYSDIHQPVTVEP
jgi:glycosyltransferase involved in cell wall biosynthesis